MGVNRVDYGDETIIDITDTTADEDSVLAGAVFYGANGEKKTGVVPRRKITDTVKADFNQTVEDAEEGELILVQDEDSETQLNETIEKQFELGYLGGKNLLYEEIKGYTLAGNSNGYYLNPMNNSITYIAKVNTNTTYVVKKFNQVGNRLRIFGFVEYPPYNPQMVAPPNASSLFDSTTDFETIVNSGSFNYLCVTTQVNDAQYFDSKPQLEEGTEATTYHPYSKSNVELTQYTNQISNPNLLDNPFFTVNQRGQSSYSGASSNVFTVDRWKMTNANTSLEVSDNGVTIKNSTDGSAGYLSQVVDNILKLLGRVVTFSAITSNNKVVSGTVVMPKTLPTANTTVLTIYDETISIGSLLFYKVGSDMQLWVRVWSNSSENERYFKAVKLELGTVSTLANDIAPDYGTELLKCQRYCYVEKNDVTGSLWLGFNGIGAGNTSLQCQKALPCAMRAKPTIVYEGVLNSWRPTNQVVSVSVASLLGNVLKANFTMTNNVEAGVSQIIYLNGAGKIVYSADL